MKETKRTTTPLPPVAQLAAVPEASLSACADGEELMMKDTPLPLDLPAAKPKRKPRWDNEVRASARRSFDARKARGLLSHFTGLCEVTKGAHDAGASFERIERALVDQRNPSIVSVLNRINNEDVPRPEEHPYDRTPTPEFVAAERARRAAGGTW